MNENSINCFSSLILSCDNYNKYIDNLHKHIISNIKCKSISIFKKNYKTLYYIDDIIYVITNNMENAGNIKLKMGDKLVECFYELIIMYLDNNKLMGKYKYEIINNYIEIIMKLFINNIYDINTVFKHLNTYKFNKIMQYEIVALSVIDNIIM